MSRCMDKDKLHFRKHADVITIDEFADMLFDKEKQESFIKKCKELGIIAEEQTEREGNI